MPKETEATSRDAILNKELGLENVYDPMALQTGASTPGPHTPAAYAEGTTPIPLITLPTSGGSRDSGLGGLASGVACPVSKHDDCLLDGLPPSSPMDVGISQAPGSGRGSCHETLMSLSSPVPLPGVGNAGVLKCLVDATPSSPFPEKSDQKCPES